MKSDQQTIRVIFCTAAPITAVQLHCAAPLAARLHLHSLVIVQHSTNGRAFSQLYADVASATHELFFAPVHVPQSEVALTHAELSARSAQVMPVPVHATPSVQLPLTVAAARIVAASSRDIAMPGSSSTVEL